MWSIGQDTSQCSPLPRLQVDQNFLTQKIVADQKIECHQNSFGIRRVTEALLGKKKNGVSFKNNILWKKYIVNHFFLTNTVIVKIYKY